MRIPLFATDGQLAPLQGEIKAPVAAVIEQGRYILGPEVAAFEAEFAGCLGEGGAIATDKDRVSALARALRSHGARDKQTSGFVGYTSGLDELQAAALRVLLPALDGWTDGRRAAAAAYEAAGLGSLVTL